MEYLLALLLRSNVIPEYNILVDAISIPSMLMYIITFLKGTGLFYFMEPYPTFRFSLDV